MDRAAAEACDAYRRIVRGHPRFVEYFRSATPEPELRAINIGSRPARRPSPSSTGSEPDGVESLRAIPWQFAWTQTRLLLASWLGVEAAVAGFSARNGEAPLDEMYDRWPFFRSTVDLIRDGARQSRRANRGPLRSRARAAGSVAARRDAAGEARDRRVPFSASHVTAGSSRTTRCFGDRSTCAIRTSIRSTWCRSRCCVLRSAGDGDERLRRVFVVTVKWDCSRTAEYGVKHTKQPRRPRRTRSKHRFRHHAVAAGA